VIKSDFCPFATTKLLKTELTLVLTFVKKVVSWYFKVPIISREYITRRVPDTALTVNKAALILRDITDNSNEQNSLAKNETTVKASSGFSSSPVAVLGHK
jgi:hypothetical protein